MSDNSYNIFCKEINLNETNSVYLDEHGIMIHLDVHHMNLDESYADMDEVEKAAACKDRYPQRENESDEAYNKRIDNLVFSGKWHVKTKNV